MYKGEDDILPNALGEFITKRDLRYNFRKPLPEIKQILLTMVPNLLVYLGLKFEIIIHRKLKMSRLYIPLRLILIIERWKTVAGGCVRF